MDVHHEIVHEPCLFIFITFHITINISQTNELNIFYFTATSIHKSLPMNGTDAFLSCPHFFESTHPSSSRRELLYHIHVPVLYVTCVYQYQYTYQSSKIHMAHYCRTS